MPNKHNVKGKFDEVMGKVTDDKAREMKGIAQNKFGDIKDKVEHLPDHLPEPDMSEESMWSMALGVVLILTGLYFILRVKDEIF